MKPFFNLLQNLIHDGYDLQGKDPLMEMRMKFLNFTLFMAAISSPLVGILHLGQWFSYSSTAHGVNCLLFSVFQVLLLWYGRCSIERYIATRNLLLLSLFLIFTSNLVLANNESMRLLWFVILLIVAQGLGGARVRNRVMGATAILFFIYLLQPLFVVNLTATDILSSLLLLALVVVLFDYYDNTIHKIMNQMEAAKRDALHMAGCKSRFLSSMSHEIRTPLNGIIGFTEMLLREESEALKIERLNYIRSSGSVLSRIIGNVLDLSKIDDGKMTVEERCYELRKELEAISIFAVTAQDKKVIFAMNIKPGTPSHIIGDSLRLNQVLGNLVNNAIKFTPSGGKVELNVALSTEEGRLGFEVVDTGVGIAEEKQTLVFSPFTQLDESVVRQFGGTGLGLSISQRLVQLMGGELGLTSRVGEGSRFFFDLPLKECRNKHLLPAANSLLPDRGHGLRILVADDDRISQVLMRDFLERMGHEVTVVADGQEVMSAYAHGDHDLILMDISMPVMDGVETTKRLRSGGVTIPIIAVTANIFKEDVDRYMGIGMTYCVSKPVDMTQLEHLIHTFCEVKA